jgi:hypothetical protein
MLADVDVNPLPCPVARPSCEWFECDDDDLDPPARRFAAALRRRAALWPMSPCNTAMYGPEDDQPTIAYLDLSLPGGRLTLLTLGVRAPVRRPDHRR